MLLSSSDDTSQVASQDEAALQAWNAWCASSPSQPPTVRSLLLELTCIDVALRVPDVQARPRPWNQRDDDQLQARASEIATQLRDATKMADALA